VADAVTARADGASAERTVGRTVSRRPRGGRHAAHRGSPPSGGSAPRLHLGRIAFLVLVLIGASFYVSPLRAFFGQQDRFEHESQALAAARTENEAYKLQVELLSTKDYVAQVARADSMLVPPDTQVFVIKGLPGAGEEREVKPVETASAGSISVFDRLDDLWRTLLR
jgi:cell division protein FtsB